MCVYQPGIKLATLIHTAMACTGLEAKATSLRNVRQVAVTALPQLNHTHRKQH